MGVASHNALLCVIARRGPISFHSGDYWSAAQQYAKPFFCWPWSVTRYAQLLACKFPFSVSFKEFLDRQALKRPLNSVVFQSIFIKFKTFFKNVNYKNVLPAIPWTSVKTFIKVNQLVDFKRIFVHLESGGSLDEVRPQIFNCQSWPKLRNKSSGRDSWNISTVQCQRGAEW